MRIAVVGLWHLGMTYSVGLAELGHNVRGLDANTELVDKLNSGNLVVHEPKLQEVLVKNLESRNLTFSDDFRGLTYVETTNTLRR